MRLICGIVRFDEEPVESGLLGRMTAALTAPGLQPRQQTWSSPGAALAVLDFQQQPTLTEHGAGRVLAADLRLDDPFPVRARPGEPEADTAGRQQQWVAALLDERGGPTRLEQISGDFALADWNPARRELLLARDAMGVRPLVLHHLPGKLVAFASFPRALHAASLPFRQVNAHSLIREVLGLSLRTETLFHQVTSVEPGTALRFTAEAVSKTTYWAPGRNRHRFRNREQATEALRDAVVAAVETRTGGSGALATHLSGGLDSSAIAVLAARRLAAQNRPLLAYSFLGSEHPGLHLRDERLFVRTLLAQEPSIEWFPVAAGNPLTARLKLDRLLSDAPDDPENVVCAHASARGASLVLSGWGGDEGATFNGRGALADALGTGRWRYLLREMRTLHRVRGFSTKELLHGEVASYLRSDLASLQRGRSKNKVPRAWREWARMLRPEVLAAAIAPVPPQARPGSNVRQNQLALINGPHLELRTSNWAEIGARFGLAFAFPLLDRHVIDCALSLHATWHLHGGWKRRPFRDAMAGILPEPIRWRHDKLNPFPQMPHVLAERRETLCQQVAELCTHAELGEIFDLDRVSSYLAAGAAPGQPPFSGSSQFSTLLLRVCATFLTQECS